MVLAAVNVTHIVLIAQNESTFPTDPSWTSTLLIMEPHSWKRSLSDRLVIVEEGKEGGLQTELTPASNSNSDGDGTAGTCRGTMPEGGLLCASEILPFTATILADTRRPGLPLVWDWQLRCRRMQRLQGHTRLHFTWGTPIDKEGKNDTCGAYHLGVKSAK